jgi:FAD dependent oxidoreductase TIGR03364
MVGLAHALEVSRRGLRVVVLERDNHAVGASVRNFGHLFAGSQPDGAGLELALRSRERWLELALRAGLPLSEAGTLIVARHEDELAVLESATQSPDRGARMLSSAEAVAHAPLPASEILGALHCRLDLRVNPREAVAKLAALLTRDPRATVRWNAPVHAVEPGRVHARGVSVRAPVIIVCPGPDLAALPPELAPGLEDLTRCRLQMLRVAAPQQRRYGPALATGLSLIRYPAFADRPPTAALRQRLESERPELLEHGIHLLVTQLPASASQRSGDLIIGDSHAYGDTLAPFGQARIDELLLGEAARLLGTPGLTVRERWLGIYATRRPGAPTQAPGSTLTPNADPDPASRYEPFHVSRPMTGVRVVENVAGIGMTLSLGFAPAVLDELI